MPVNADSKSRRPTSWIAASVSDTTRRAATDDESTLASRSVAVHEFVEVERDRPRSVHRRRRTAGRARRREPIRAGPISSSITASMRASSLARALRHRAPLTSRCGAPTREDLADVRSAQGTPESRIPIIRRRGHRVVQLVGVDAEAADPAADVGE